MTTGLVHGDPYIRAAVFFGFSDMVRQAGGDPMRLVERVGIDPDALTDPDMLISWQRLGVLMELAAAELDKPFFGIEWALSIPPHFPNVGPVVFMAQLVDTLGEWLDQGARYWRYHTNAYLVQLLDDGVGDTVTMRFWQSPLILPPRQPMEHIIAYACNMARVVTGLPDEDPVAVRFRHPRPEDTSLHEEAFRCDMQFEAEHTDIVFARSLLDSPTNGRLKSLKTIVDSFIRYRIRRMPLYDQSVRATVEMAIQSVIGTGSCTKEFIAGSMGTSPKKLQRLLAHEGTSFSDVLDQTRQSMACRMLAQTGVPISSVAGLLEYSSTTAFTLAFKRWMGLTPREYRKKAGIAISDDEAGELLDEAT